MPKGNPTPAAKVAEFRAHYLYNGSASAAAREVGIPESTGRALAVKLSKDPTFSEDQRDLHARALESLVTMRMQVAEESLSRFQGNDDIDYQERGEGNVTIVDKRGEYGRLVLDAEKNAHSLAKIEHGRSEVGEAATINIHVSGPAEAKTEP